MFEPPRADCSLPCGPGDAQRRGAARRKLSPVALLRCAVLLCGVFLMAVVLASCGRSWAEVPQQPVAYSHATHVEAGLECSRCHGGAEANKRAGLPPLATCVSCHRRQIPDHPEVKKLLAAWESRTPILWEKVNVIPTDAAVQFHHGAHARAGIECSTCHGDVASMAVAEPVVDVARMGWCVQCHRDSGASDDCLACHY